MQTSRSARSRPEPRRPSLIRSRQQGQSRAEHTHSEGGAEAPKQQAGRERMAYKQAAAASRQDEEGSDRQADEEPGCEVDRDEFDQWCHAGRSRNGRQCSLRRAQIGLSDVIDCGRHAHGVHRPSHGWNSFTPSLFPLRRSRAYVDFSRPSPYFPSWRWIAAGTRRIARGKKAARDESEDRLFADSRLRRERASRSDARYKQP